MYTVIILYKVISIIIIKIVINYVKLKLILSQAMLLEELQILYFI